MKIKVLFTTLVFLFLFPSPVQASVVINEIYHKANPGDWVELYSSSTEDISGWYVKDPTLSNKKVIPEGTSITGFYIVEMSDYLNTTGDTVFLYDKNDQIIDQKIFTDSGDNKSWGRYPDAGTTWYLCTMTKGIVNVCDISTPTPTQTPTPTPTATPIQTIQPTSTPTATPSSKGYVNIKDAKDGATTLSNVEIYVDNVYVHHYAPETITFCDNCTCDGYVACGFGNHKFTFKKTGYQNYEIEKTVNNGDNIEINPILSLLSSSSTPTPKPTTTPKVTPKSSPTSTPEVLGESTKIEEGNFKIAENTNSESVNTAEPKPNSSTKPIPIIPFILIFIGIVICGATIWVKVKSLKNTPLL